MESVSSAVVSRSLKTGPLSLFRLKARLMPPTPNRFRKSVWTRDGQLQESNCSPDPGQRQRHQQSNPRRETFPNQRFPFHYLLHISLLFYLITIVYTIPSQGQTEVTLGTFDFLNTNSKDISVYLITVSVTPAIYNYPDLFTSIDANNGGYRAYANTTTIADAQATGRGFSVAITCKSGYLIQMSRMTITVARSGPSDDGLRGFDVWAMLCKNGWDEPGDGNSTSLCFMNTYYEALPWTKVTETFPAVQTVSASFGPSFPMASANQAFTFRWGFGATAASTMTRHQAKTASPNLQVLHDLCPPHATRRRCDEQLCHCIPQVPVLWLLWWVRLRG